MPWLYSSKYSERELLTLNGTEENKALVQASILTSSFYHLLTEGMLLLYAGCLMPMPVLFVLQCIKRSHVALKVALFIIVLNVYIAMNV